MGLACGAYTGVASIRSVNHMRKGPRNPPRAQTGGAKVIAFGIARVKQRIALRTLRRGIVKFMPEKRAAAKGGRAAQRAQMPIPQMQFARLE